MSLRLAPSKIHGVGVFATKAFASGRLVPVWAAGHPDCRFVKHGEVPRGEKKLFETWAVETAMGFHAPIDFSRMSLGWYLNHSTRPNLASKDRGETYRATRTILAGQELTIDYRKLDEDVDNRP